MILDRIVQTKRIEVTELHAAVSVQEARDRAEQAGSTRDFFGALFGVHPAMGLIAEVKKASPSKGLIRADFDPVQIAQSYERAGAHCLSVLTDREYFQGEPGYLRAARDACQLPVLRKDFIIDERQIFEARWLLADAVLLITAILDDAQLRGYRETAEHLGMSALVEVHDEREMERALASGAKLIGVNNRDLRDFTVDLNTTERLARYLPEGALLVSESGLGAHDDILRVQRAGARAVLVGESLMRASSVESAVRTLMGTTA